MMSMLCQVVKVHVNSVSLFVKDGRVPVSVVRVSLCTPVMKVRASDIIDSFWCKDNTLVEVFSD